LINKYLDLMWDCDTYIVAIAMCPDRKLAWFKNKLHYSNERMQNLKSIIVRAWKKYAPDKPEGSQHQKKDKSRKAALAEVPVAKHGYDHIETYLKEPVVVKEGIVAAGGYLNYW
ncbi:hypothetical protein K443DRAFT_70717, partial [Laccaria amethystina LaAM-08-1]